MLTGLRGAPLHDYGAPIGTAREKECTPHMHIATKPQVIFNTPGGSKSLLMKMMTCLPRQSMDGWMDVRYVWGDVQHYSKNNDVRGHGR